MAMTETPIKEAEAIRDKMPAAGVDRTAISRRPDAELDGSPRRSEYNEATLELVTALSLASGLPVDTLLTRAEIISF